ncbi:MAG: hypothetical protein Q7W44_07180 [Coriobacteriia bacterium]|nr:hypothetical protein [Coriobacteriia bacterium]
MPLQWRLHVLEVQLKERIGRPVRVVQRSLYHLAGTERTAAVDVLVSGAELPLVLVGDRVACTGSLDPDAVSAAIRELG